ncbi:MAG: hypothetical protein ACLTDF_10800 [Coprococcus sp.]
MAKPYTSRRMQDEKYCRTSFCVSTYQHPWIISTRICWTSSKKTVDELQGERFGIVIFNTSPVLLTPLTDDYEYVKDHLI